MKASFRSLALLFVLFAPFWAGPMATAQAAAPAGKGQQGQAGQQASGARGGDLQALRREAKDLALSPEEIASIGRILDEKASDLARAASEVKILQARLERIMLDPEPSLEDMRKIVRQSLDFEFNIRMIRIERSLAMRRLLGDQRWASLERLQRAYDQARKTGLVDGGGDLGAPLLGLLGRL